MRKSMRTLVFENDNIQPSVVDSVSANLKQQVEDDFTTDNTLISETNTLQVEEHGFLEKNMKCISDMCRHNELEVGVFGLSYTFCFCTDISQVLENPCVWVGNAQSQNVSKVADKTLRPVNTSPFVLPKHTTQTEAEFVAVVVGGRPLTTFCKGPEKRDLKRMKPLLQKLVFNKNTGFERVWVFDPGGEILSYWSETGFLYLALRVVGVHCRSRRGITFVFDPGENENFFVANIWAQKRQTKFRQVNMMVVTKFRRLSNISLVFDHWVQRSFQEAGIDTHRLYSEGSLVI
ncbi:hypothetical protein RND81_03G105300 [Saponaria officinalis]|uniref:Uncharacterized protein n=1 Tax=Saponaria officinalis TaxID=3572 RepID=A0AAW1M6K8_SAPOF